MNLAALAQQRDAIREERRAIAARDKELIKDLDALDAKLFEILDEQGVNGIDSDGITLSISETVLPSVKDWPAVYAYVAETGRFELFERRMASTAFRELLEMGVQIPGTESFTKRAINMRKYR